MIISIHQPNYLPWCGFFHKMSQSDQFVLLDVVPFSKNSYQNRCRIKTPEGSSWLSVPVVTKGRLGQATSAVEISSSTKWARKHWMTIEQRYRQAEHFDVLSRCVGPVLSREWTLLTELTITLIERLRDALGLTVPLIRASELNVSGHGTELLCAICVKLGASIYLSGPTGRTYLDPAMFASRGVDVAFHEFNHPVYTQAHGQFTAGLSVIDLLAHAGADALEVLKAKECS